MRESAKSNHYFPGGAFRVNESSEKKNVIEWQITGSCNYRCSYCIQGNSPKKGFQPGKTELSRALENLGSMPGKWEIKISGGEPFQSPHFLDLVIPHLVQKTSHSVSILTNLSARPEELALFARLTHGRLVTFSSSFHAEYVPLEHFLQKAIFLQNQLGNQPLIKVNVVLYPGKIKKIIEYRKKIGNAGLSFYGQFYKENGRVFKYGLLDRFYLYKLIKKENSPKRVNKAPSYFGARCLAGTSYFVVQKDGAAWACRSARRQGEYFLGNIYTEPLRLLKDPIICGYEICPCSVPHNRNLISYE